jgi:hypothetical protein
MVKGRVGASEVAVVDAGFCMFVYHTYKTLSQIDDVILHATCIASREFSIPGSRGYVAASCFRVESPLLSHHASQTR